MRVSDLITSSVKQQKVIHVSKSTGCVGHSGILMPHCPLVMAVP
jgi:hypothetical protein